MEVSSKKIVIALVLVFLLGVLFAIVNGFYIQKENQTLPIIVYGISFVSIILGGIIVIMFQWKMSVYIKKKGDKSWQEKSSVSTHSEAEQENQT